METDFAIVVPVLVEHVWCAYMFDMHHAEVHVLDPAYASSRYHAHQEIYKMLLRTLCDSVVCFFEGWLLNPIESWKLQYPMLFLADINRDETGFAMLHYARNFNGVQLEEAVNKDSIMSIRHSMLVDILMMEDNAAQLPESLLRCLC